MLRYFHFDNVRLLDSRHVHKLESDLASLGSPDEMNLHVQYIWKAWLVQGRSFLDERDERAAMSSWKAKSAPLELHPHSP